MIVYRRVSEEELDNIMDLVIRTFTGEQDIPYEMNYIPSEKNPQWFCAEENGKIIGTVVFFREDEMWHAGRFALEPEYRGKHIGTQLISFAFTEMFGIGMKETVMEARPATVHILTKLGAQVTGEQFPFYRETCTPIRMMREQFQPYQRNIPDFIA